LGSEKAQYRGGAWHNATVVSSTPDSIQISWKYDGSLDEARGFDNEVFSKPLWLWLVYTIVLIFFIFLQVCALTVISSFHQIFWDFV